MLKYAAKVARKQESIKIDYLGRVRRERGDIIFHIIFLSPMSGFFKKQNKTKQKPWACITFKIKYWLEKCPHMIPLNL